MAKRHPGIMNNLIRVVITGPECTGKSSLATRLAGHFGAEFIPEYAREYIEALRRPYTYADVLHIAEKQLEQAEKGITGKSNIVFFDTWLIITKVWFDVLYGHYPLWIDEELNKGYINLWLICNTDIPWVPDKVRENGGEMREILYRRYLYEIEKIHARNAIISGTGEQRFVNALKAIDKYFPDICAKSN
jgi:nicotinamide riboside kinase